MVDFYPNTEPRIICYLQNVKGQTNIRYQIHYLPDMIFARHQMKPDYLYHIQILYDRAKLKAMRKVRVLKTNTTVAEQMRHSKDEGKSTSSLIEGATLIFE